MFPLRGTAHMRFTSQARESHVYFLIKKEEGTIISGNSEAVLKIDHPHAIWKNPLLCEIAKIIKNF